MKKVELDVGSLSWIHQQVTPIWPLLADGKLLSPNWIPQTYIGLYATRNQVPPPSLDPSYAGTRQFRAMCFARLTVALSDDSKRIVDVQLSRKVLNPGWTPPFDRSISLLTRLVAVDDSMKDPNYHPGELGLASDIVLRARHPNATITPAADAIIVASALILFRAGPITDDIGTRIVQCPNHVPWVWSEWLVTLEAGTLKVHATGSAFPTHSFYAQGKSFGQQDEPTDARFMRSWRHPLTIDTSVLRVYPILTAGAPATGPQATDKTGGLTLPVTSIPFTVAGSGIRSTTRI